MPVIRMQDEANDELTEANETSDSTSKGLLPWEQTKVFTETIPGLGSIQTVRAEIDDALEDMRLFHQNEPDVVIQAVSAHGARLAEIVTRIRRIEVRLRHWKATREEAEFVLGQLRDQYQMHSRLLTVRQLDQSLMGGQP